MLQVTSEVRRFDPAALKPSLAGLAQGLSRCDDCARRLREALNAPGTTDSAVARSLSGQLDVFLKGAPRRTSDSQKLSADLTALLASADAPSALGILCGGDLPALGPASAMDPQVKAALDAVETGQPDEEIGPLLARVSDPMLDEALRAAWERARSFGTALEPVNQFSDQLDELLARQMLLAQESGTVGRLVEAVPPEAGASLRATGETLASACTAVEAKAMRLNRDFTVARLRYDAGRYDSEARVNQTIADLYELQVRKNNTSAERHHARSQRFFYGMLAAQMGVIIATLAMAARQRNLLWSLAAAAGLVAVCFAVYVFLYV